MPTVFCHDCFLSNPTGGFDPLLTPHRPQTRALSSCLFPAWITHLSTPRGCGQPQAVRELPTLETDAFRVQNAKRFTHSSCPGLRRFFKKITMKAGIAANTCPRVLPTPFGRGQPTAPLLIGQQVAGARAPKGAQGAQHWGAGGSMPHARSRPRRRRDAGEKRAAKRLRPLARPPAGEPRCSSCARAAYNNKSLEPPNRPQSLYPCGFQPFSYMHRGACIDAPRCIIGCTPVHGFDGITYAP